MSRDHKHWVNNNNTNIVIINSGDGSYRIGSSPRNASPDQNAHTSKDGDGELKTIQDYPSLEDSEDRGHKTPMVVSPVEESSFFHRPESNKMKMRSQFNSDKGKIFGKSPLALVLFSVSLFF